MGDNCIIPQLIERCDFAGRSVWRYLIQSTIGDLHIVQHETREEEVVDDYIGWSNQKAEKAFERTTIKIIKGKI